MADQNTQFMAILTAVGEAKLANAQALGIVWNITQLGVGDANGAEPTPDRLQTALINERRRAPLNQLFVSPDNASIIVAEQVIPEDVGGWWIREIGLYDEANDLVAVANCPPTFKPLLAQGSGRTQVVRLNLLVSSTQSITLKIDPSVVLATRAYCDGKVAEELAKLDHKNSVRAATTANIALNALQTIDGVALAAGDRVLVKNQAAAAGNGIYVVSGGAWTRAADADASIEVTPGMIVPVEQGTANADSVWQLATDAPITLGTTALVFEAAAGPSGVTAGTYRSVTVDKRGRVTGGTNPAELTGLNFAAFTIPGTYTFTVPAGVSRLLVEVWGAGGGGGATHQAGSSGGGGGAGGYARGVVDLPPGTTVTVFVGAGGAGNAAAAQSQGGAGQGSSFGTHITASGGGGGLSYYAGSGGGSGGDIYGANAGGSIGGSGAAGVYGGSGAVAGGAGGGPFSGGGGSGGGSGTNDGAAPSPGRLSSGGGGSSSTTVDGAVGGSGQVIVWW